MSTGRPPRSSFFELPRDIYSKELLPEAQALEYKAECLLSVPRTEQVSRWGGGRRDRGQRSLEDCRVSAELEGREHHWSTTWQSCFLPWAGLCSQHPRKVGRWG